MKIFCFSFLLLFLIGKSMLLESQVYNWAYYTDFENMTAGAPPSGGWMTVGGFSVMGSPHGELSGSKVNGISKELNSSSGSGNVDSIISPRITGTADCGYYDFSFNYRICNWSGGVPVSATVLNPGDTCYIYLYKYSGSAISSRLITDKIHKGNHTQSGVNYEFKVSNCFPATIAWSDTIAAGIKVKRGASGNYWYDIDNFYPGGKAGVPENQKQTEIQVYPNPAQNSFQIRLNQSEQLEAVTIKNTAGQTVLFLENMGDNKLINIDINSLSKGLYFAEILLKNGQKTSVKLVRS